MSIGQKLSNHLGIPKEVFEELGVFDPFIGVDTHLFLDPALLRKTDIEEFKGSYGKLVAYFQVVLKLLAASKKPGDAFWKEARNRLIFRETKGISIGYGAATSDGNAIGKELAAKMATTAGEIVHMGISDPSLFEVISLFEEGLGSDRISDMAISIIEEDVLTYTDRITKQLGLKPDQVEIVKNKAGTSFQLVRNPVKEKPLLLLPRDLLKDLPLALTRDQIGHVCYFNDELRRKVSSLIVRDAARGIKDITKPELKAALLNPKSMAATIKSYKAAEPQKYDFANDPKGEVNWYEKGEEIANNFPIEIENKKPKNLKEVNEIVRQIIQQFKRNIESNELYEVLYKEPVADLKPKNERFAQRLFYSVADTYCRANNLVLSREPNAGNGPVDFKIAQDYKTQVLVEIKLSSGKVRTGFEKQVPEYEKNENAAYSFLVIIKVTQTAKQVEDILAMARIAQEEKKYVPEIVLVNGLPRPSASIPKVAARKARPRRAK